MSIFIRYGLPAIIVLAMLFGAYSWAYNRGQAACEAKYAAAAERANAKNESASAKAGASLNTELQERMPAIQENANASVERIRTVYVDRPVDGSCAWSGGVRAELEAGRQAANRAVRGGAGSADPADPGLAK